MPLNRYISDLKILEVDLRTSLGPGRGRGQLVDIRGQLVDIRGQLVDIRHISLNID